jgi:hypothetical protein
MKLILIFGPQAVGNMTVGHDLEKITDLELALSQLLFHLLNERTG